MTETEVWLIDRFWQNFASYYVGPDFGELIPPTTIPKRAPLDLIRYAMRQNKRTIRRLAPWVLAITFKLLDSVRRITGSYEYVPSSLVEHQSWKETCRVLYELLKDARNEIVHGRGYRVRRLPYREPKRKKTYQEDYVVVRTKKTRDWQIALPDLFAIAHLVASIASVLGDPSPRRRDILDIYSEIKGLQTLGYLRKGGDRS